MKPAKVTVKEFDKLHRDSVGLPSYCGPLSRHIDDGDHRIAKLKFDNSAASFRLWNFLLTEEERLFDARNAGKYIVGTMKDLGTIPVMTYAIPDTIAFYPDGAWWIPCIMELSAGLLAEADNLGIDESFCPVRAMLGAFITGNHFPPPDLLICSMGAVCDDFSAIAQRLEGLGYPIEWWEMPHIRASEPGEESLSLPNGRKTPLIQQKYLIDELSRMRKLLAEKTGKPLSDEMLRKGIIKTNKIRKLLKELRSMVFQSEASPLPALEVLIAEMLAIHYCSDIDETEKILTALVAEVKSRIKNKNYIGDRNATKIFWVNPVADLRVMNILEEAGCRLCGTDFMFTHALDEIPENISPLEALAITAMSDPMTSDSKSRAERICRDISQFGAEALIISKIPGASHCAFEGKIISDIVKKTLDIPVTEIEVPTLADAFKMNIKTKIQTLKEIVDSQPSTINQKPKS